MAFGGPAAHVAIMEDEVVRRRNWLSRQHFLDLLGAATLIPGPSSTELAIYIGYRLAGLAGLVLAGTCFILPAALIVCALAAAYVRWGSLPGVTALLRSLYPVVIAIVVQAISRLGRTAVKTRTLAVIGFAAAATAYRGANPPLVLIAGGGAAALLHLLARDRAPGSLLPAIAGILVPIAASPTPFTVAAGTTPAAGLLPLFLIFLKFGAVIFGSGYVLLPFLQSDLVTHRHWISQRQLLDAVLIGQVTPGPVFTTATFIGYLLARGRGAVAATVGIFLPAFALVAISGPLVPRIRRSKIAGVFLDGLNVASLGLMAAVTLQLGRGALDRGLLPWVIALGSAAVLFLTRVNALWLIAAAATIGLLAARHG